jgi:hypothetical protein
MIEKGVLMRTLLFVLMVSLSAGATEIVAYFKEDPNHAIFCRQAESAYTVLTQKNAKPVVVRDQHYFKLKDQNLYIPAVACHPLHEAHQLLIY